MKKFIIILVMMLMFTLPVSAYTVLSEYTVANTTTKGGMTDISFNSTTGKTDYLNHIDKVSWDGYCWPTAAGQNISFTSPMIFASGGKVNHDADATLTYGVTPGPLNTLHTCTIDIVLENKNAITNFGGGFYYLGNSSYWTTPQLFYTEPSSWIPSNDQVVIKSSGAYAGGHYIVYNGTAMSIPVSDFNGTPLAGAAPQLITLTDASTGGSLTYNWSGSGPGTMWWGPVTTQNTSVYLSTPGNYTITHGVENAMGSDIETKTDYIWIYDDNATVTTEFVTIDAIGGAAILNASVSLRDVENSTWTNSSTNAMGSAYITTLVGHTINAYASAIGFKDNDLLGVEAVGPPQGYAILMQPKGYFNVSSGYVTLYVSVFDDGTSEPISGASVTVAKSNGMAELWQTTNAAGIATFPVENETDFIAQASKAGYSTASKGVNSGTGSGGDATVSVNIWLAKGTVTPTTTMTAGPGGTVPVTQDPYLSLSPEEKQSALATDVMNYGPMLVNFFILLTIVGGFKMITK